ncbi:MAG: hydrogenase nickel incorporation protein HypB [Nevskia sp.]|nr:hydrogenase nickel incorporation protein HypB [Nevskia sp.]
MCTTCGCSGERPDDSPGFVLDLRGKGAAAAPPPPSNLEREEKSRRILLEQAILDKNRRIAERNRGWFANQSVAAINLLSAPGSGKTTLLERTVRQRGDALGIRVIEGDQATSLDADRIAAAGAQVLQVNTGTGCHLDAEMIERALAELRPARSSCLFIENVGNLVCPALFDLGERRRVVIAAVTEGEDKPLKYPHMFRGCDLVLLNKIDLLPYVPFDVRRFESHLRTVNPHARMLPLSALNGDGMDAWYGWLEREQTGS